MRRLHTSADPPIDGEIQAKGAFPMVFAVASGKGGVGKTSLVANLGISLAGFGRRVCVFDADTNLANINILLRLHPKHTMEQYLRGEVALDDILISGPGPVSIVPSASGIADLVSLSRHQRSRLLRAVRRLEQRFDYLLIDCAAGINETVLSFLLSTPYVVLVITTEPTSVTDAYSLLKVLHERGLDRPVYVIANKVPSYARALELYRRFRDTVKTHIGASVHTLGYVLSDERMDDAVHQQAALVMRYPESPAARCISALAKLIHSSAQSRSSGRAGSLWQALARQFPDTEDVAYAQLSLSESDAFMELMARAERLLDHLGPEELSRASQALSSLQSKVERRAQLPMPEGGAVSHGLSAGLEPRDPGRLGKLQSLGEARLSASQPFEQQGLIYALELASRLAEAEAENHSLN